MSGYDKFFCSVETCAKKEDRESINIRNLPFVRQLKAFQTCNFALTITHVTFVSRQYYRNHIMALDSDYLLPNELHVLKTLFARETINDYESLAVFLAFIDKH